VSAKGLDTYLDDTPHPTVVCALLRSLRSDTFGSRTACSQLQPTVPRAHPTLYLLPTSIAIAHPYAMPHYATCQPLNTFLKVILSCNIPKPCHLHSSTPATTLLLFFSDTNATAEMQLPRARNPNIGSQNPNPPLSSAVLRMGCACSDEIQFYVKNSYFTNLCQSITNVEKRIVKLC